MTAQRDRKFNSHERHVLTITGYGHFISHFNMLVFPAVVIPLSVQMNLEIAEVFGLSFWMYLLFGITALPWGMLADRWKVRNMLFIFYSGAAFSSMIAALMIDSPLGFMLSLAGIGLFSGIYHPAGLGWISKDVEQITMGMAYNGMMGNLGLAMAPLIAGVVTWFYGPKIVFFVVALMNISGAALILLRSEPEKETLKKVEKTDEKGNLNAFMILLVAMMMAGIAYRGVTVVTPTYFELKNQGIFMWLSGLTDWNLSKNLIATSITSLIFLIGMFGQYTGGRLAAKFDLKSCYLVFHLLTLPPIFSLAYVYDIPLVLLTIIYFFFLLGMQPIENTIVSELTPPALKHSAYGFKFIVTFGVGALAVKLVEFVQSSYGIEFVFPIMGGVSIVIVLAILTLIAYTRKRKTAVLTS